MSRPRILDISPNRKPFVEQLSASFTELELNTTDAPTSLAVLALNTCEALLRALDKNGIKG